MTLNALIENNYSSLQVVARRITHDTSKSLDLLSETYFNLVDKKVEFPTDSEEFVKWFSKCMKNRFVWPNSSYNKIQKSKECLSLDNNNVIAGKFWDSYFDNSYKDLIVDEDALKEIELCGEEANEVTRELIEISSSLGTAKTLKYIEVIEFKRSLLEYERILFELYFEKELSTREIAKLYSDSQNKMNYQSVNAMVNIIKTKIKEHKWKQGS